MYGFPGNTAIDFEGKRAQPRFMDIQRRLEAAGPLGSYGKGGILPPLFVKMDSRSRIRGCPRGKRAAGNPDGAPSATGRHLILYVFPDI